METTQSLAGKFAENLTQLQPEGVVVNWDIRGDLGDMQLYDRTLIAIVSFTTSTEEIYGNRTQRLSGTITGQISAEQLTNDDINMALDELQEVTFEYFGGLRYTEVGDAVVLQATCDTILTEPKQGYYNFYIPLDVVVQF